MREKIRLKDIAIHSKGQQINGTDLIEGGKYDYLNGGINPSGKWNEYNNEGNTVTISEGGNSSGYVNFMSEPFWCGAHCYYLYDVKGHSKYLFYALKSKQDQIMHLRTGATMPNIKKSVLGEFTFTYDNNLEEQEKVVQILEKTEKIIENRKAQLSDLDNLIKSRFVDMFGDPISNPLKWRVDKLCNIGKLGRGVSKHRPRNAPELLGGQYPLIQTGDVANADLYITEYKSTYSEIGLKQSKMWEKGTLCITIAANIAKTSILSFDACFPDSVVGFDPNENTNNVFMHYWFAFFQQLLESQAPESAQKNINLQILSDLNVIVPPKEEQDQFERFVHHVDKLKVEVQKSLDETQKLFDSLMQEYFN